MQKWTQALLAVAIVAAVGATWVGLGHRPVPPPVDDLPLVPPVTPPAAVSTVTVPAPTPPAAFSRANNPAPIRREQQAPNPTPMPIARERARFPLLVDVVHNDGSAASLAHVRVRMNEVTRSAVTDAAGRTRFVFDAKARTHAERHGAWLEVEAPAAPERTRFTTWDPERPFRIVLQPAGTLLVELIDASGLHAAERGNRFTFRVRGGTYDRAVRNGHCVLQGMRLRESATFHSLRSRFTISGKSRLSELRSTGDVVRCRVRLRPKTRVADVRVFDPDGAPLAEGTPVRVFCFRRHANLKIGCHPKQRYAIAGGRVRLRMPSKRVVAVRIATLENGRVRASTTVVPPCPADGERHADLGDVHLETARLLASGRVFELDVAASSGWAPVWTDVALHTAHEESFVRRLWHDAVAAGQRRFVSAAAVPYAIAKTDEDGRFAIWGVPRAPAFSLVIGDTLTGRLRKNGITPGTRCITVRLGGNRRIEGRVTCARPLPPHLFVVVHSKNGRRLKTRVDESGHFASEWLRAETASVELHAKGIAAPLVRRAAVPTSIEGQNAPPLVLSLDDVPWITIRVRDESGNAIPDAVAEQAPKRTDHWLAKTSVRHADETGRIHLLAARAPISVRIRAPRRLGVTLEDVRTDRAVRLIKGIPIQFELRRHAWTLIHTQTVELARPGHDVEAIPLDTLLGQHPAILLPGRNEIRITDPKTAETRIQVVDVQPGDKGRKVKLDL